MKDYRQNAASTWKKLGAKTTQVNVHMATADRDRQGQATHRRYKLRPVEFRSLEEGPCIINTHN